MAVIILFGECTLLFEVNGLNIKIIFVDACQENIRLY